jgi:hypothetical protein
VGQRIERETMLKIFIGYDSNEIVAYHTCVQSIIDHAVRPVSIIPICKDHVKDIYTRDRGETESTEFSMTRFLVPYLSDYEGYSIFVDCDVIFRADPHQLCVHAMISEDFAVSVVKHHYTPKTEEKFLHQVQTKYEKKNWSSVMVFNNEKCKALTPAYVSQATGLELHQFKWLDSDDDIGELPIEWNHLVGEYAPNPNAKLVHFTLGTPCFSDWKDQEHSDEWFDVMRKATSATQASFKTIRNEVRNDPALSFGGEW